MNKNFEQIFKPFSYITTIWCVKKYNLKKHKILQIDKKDIIVSVLATVGILILYYITFHDLALLSVSPLMSYIYILTYLQYAINHVIMKIMNFVQRQNNLALFSTLQEICKHLSLRKELENIKIQVILPCIFAIGVYLIFIVYKLTTDSSWTWTRGLFIFSTVIFDLELAYSGFIVIFLSNKIETWTKILRNIDERINNYEAVIKKMDKVFNMLIDAVNFNKKAFQLMVIKN